jgi:glycine cleavage system aminomethyltransferase T/NADPH-dependent 2,4-dienoyl-CoA reductase/sulfur reductase-like enzyme
VTARKAPRGATIEGVDTGSATVGDASLVRAAAQRDPTRYGTRLGPGAFTFTFDGQEYCAREGDTAASALLAHGVRWFGRSVKSRRLRGVFTGGAEEPSALLTVGVDPLVVPNVPATQLVLQPGMVLRSQNRWPSLRYDLASLLQAGGGLFTAGFYYKTFFLPSWRTFEPLIRRLAGLGVAPGTQTDAGESADGPAGDPMAAEEHLQTDVLVIGAGPAGMAAAVDAVREGLGVVLCEREPVTGGELEFEDAVIDGQPAHEWMKAIVTRYSSAGATVRPTRNSRRAAPVAPAAGTLRLLLGTVVVAESGGEVMAYSTPHANTPRPRLFRIRANRVVNAVGALEQPIAFVGNDLPGIMLLGGAERFASRYGVVPQGATVLFGNHDRLYASALRLRGCGADIRAVIDTRATARDNEWCAAAIALLEAVGVQCLSGHVVDAALGKRELSAVRVAPSLAAYPEPHGLPGPTGGGAAATAPKPQLLPCRTLLVSGGWVPNRGLPSGANVGAAAGHFDLAAVLPTGHSANGDPAPRVEAFHRVPCLPQDEKRQYLDLQNDVTVADLRVAIAEGFTDIEHAKRYTTLGIGTDQGRTGGVLGAAVLAELLHLPTNSVRTSRARPPLAGIALQQIAGRRIGRGFRVLRQTPLHEEHLAGGGSLDPMGLWLRPRYYRANGVDAAVAAPIEAARVRAAGGIVDCSTLGKLEVAGPDAAAFLDEVYLTRVSSLTVGRSAYRVMLREDGMVLDDGLVLRVAEDRFFLTTSSGHGLHVLSHLEHHLARHTAQRRVAITDLTDRWAVIAVAGPQSAATLRAALPALTDIVPGLAPMAFHEVTFEGGRLRLLRAGFSGELAYELYCAPALAASVWRQLVGFGLQPYGLDALDILRVEKGLLTTSEINGQVTPFDLGMESMVAQGNPCIGSALLGRPAFQEAARPRLVGLRAADGQSAFLAGAQLTADSSSSQTLGYVTSAVHSPALGQTVALALLARHIPMGTVVHAREPQRRNNVQVLVVSPVHFDAAGVRARVQP